MVKTKRLCYRCLDSGHIGSACPMDKRCKAKDCNAKHHTLMHGAPRLNSIPAANHSNAPSPSRPPAPSTFKPSIPPVSAPATAPILQYAGTTVVSSNRGTLLAIVPVEIESEGVSIRTHALLDTGSTVTMVKDWVADKLKLKGPKVLMSIGTAEGYSAQKLTKVVDFKVSNLEGDIVLDVERAKVKGSFDIDRRTIDMERLMSDWPHLNSLPLTMRMVEEVSLIVGLDHPAFHEILDQRVDRLQPKAPRAILTLFGWCVVGPISSPAKNDDRCMSFVTSIVMDERLDLLVKDFLEQDQFGVKPDATSPIGEDDRRALDIMERTFRHIGDRYEIGAPWKSDNPAFPNNMQAALRRLFSLERRFKADSVLARAYSQVMKSTFALNYARKLTPLEVSLLPIGFTWYLCHHAVFNPNKPGKCRVVYDGAFTYEGTSLNSELLKGPDYLPNLAGILLRFRQYPIALVADIEKMFYQVRICKEDRSAFCFLWREPGSSDPPAVYQMNSHIFGAISSPSVCSLTLRRAAKDSGSPQVVREIEDHFYVDNWLVSYQTETEAIASSKIVYDALLRGGFKLTQWASSSPLVRASFPDGIQSELNLDLDSTPVERTLGLKWDFNRDVFVLSVAVAESDVYTKRALLRIVSSVFDPLGFLAVVVFTAKTLLQDVWRQSDIGWDTEVTGQLLIRWENWLDSLSHLKSLTLPRCYFLNSPMSTQLHLFADASELGFGGVAYLRQEYGDKVEVSFVLAKCRVSPLKFVSIPRSELCAAVMSVRLALLVRNELRIPLDGVTYWSDSTTVLGWIKSSTFRYHVYVGNRLGEILDSSKPDQWHYVPSALNPADDLSRGVNAADLNEEHRWFHGPSFLLEPPDCWPVSPFIPPPDAGDPEVREVHWCGLVVRKEDEFDVLLNKVSRLNHLFRTSAYVLRWVRNKRLAND